MFELAKVGDKIWHFFKGWNEIKAIDENMGILVHFWDNTESWFLFDGKFSCIDALPSIFWDEIKFEIPPKPKKMISKTVNGWVNIYPESNATSEYNFFDDKKAAYRCFGNLHNGALSVPATLTYEIEE